MVYDNARSKEIESIPLKEANDKVKAGELSVILDRTLYAKSIRLFGDIFWSAHYRMDKTYRMLYREAKRLGATHRSFDEEIMINHSLDDISQRVVFYRERV